MTRKASFNQADVTRAVRGAQAAGITVGTVRISPDGVIEVYSQQAAQPQRLNSLDRVLG